MNKAHMFGVYTPYTHIYTLLELLQHLIAIQAGISAADHEHQLSTSVSHHLLRVYARAQSQGTAAPPDRMKECSARCQVP